MDENQEKYPEQLLLAPSYFKSNFINTSKIVLKGGALKLILRAYCNDIGYEEFCDCKEYFQYLDFKNQVKQMLGYAYTELLENKDFSEYKSFGFYLVDREAEDGKNFNLAEIFKIKDSDTCNILLVKYLSYLVVNTNIRDICSVNKDNVKFIEDNNSRITTLEGFIYMIGGFLFGKYYKTYNEINFHDEYGIEVACCGIKNLSKVFNSERITIRNSSASINLLHVIDKWIRTNIESKKRTNTNSNRETPTNKVGTNFLNAYDNWTDIVDVETLSNYIDIGKTYVRTNIKNKNAVMKSPRYVAESFITNFQERYIRYGLISASMMSSALWFDEDLQEVLEREYEKAKNSGKSIDKESEELFFKRRYPLLQIIEEKIEEEIKS